ncbi:MAG: DUF3800 domain-containing protein [Mucilaginibacter sp.]|jgi:hypothetical protein|uniref:DUF3800 domain-containing protein n=1 Tax=Mucilaginibacter sp. TaxID=1882438 RepID=UPI000EB23E24
MSKVFNVYCDESGHLENDGMPYMLLGYVSIPKEKIKLFKDEISNIKDLHNFYSEIKWANVSNSKSEFYLDIIRFFFASELKFRVLVVKKDEIKNDLFGQDYDTFYYKMYYQLLHHQIDMLYNYNIYLDIKDTLSSWKVRKLKEILQTKYGVVKNLQNIHSHESVFLQIADLMMGAIGYHLRGLNKVSAKIEIIKLMQSLSGSDLSRSTPKNEEKLNMFFIDL